MMKQATFPFLKQTAHAVLSEDRIFRYVLYRSLDGEDWDAPVNANGLRRTVCFVLLNPSTADERTNDPTIEKIIKYGVHWGFQRLAVVNLFAIRETDSTKLKHMVRVRDIIGPDNDAFILSVARSSDQVVCGWGLGGSIGGRGEVVNRVLAPLGQHKISCLKINQDGSPVHPLYQPDVAQLIAFVGSP